MESLSTFTREKKIVCGKRYMEVDIIPRTIKGDAAAKRARKRREKVTSPKQQNLNDKNAKRYLVQLGNANFGKGDLAVHCTYSPEFLPESEEAAIKELTNFLRRISYRRKKCGLSELKYIAVTECGKDKETGKIRRIHHHIIMNAGLDRDEVELMWAKGRGKNRKQMGWVNTDRIQVNENGVEALVKYMVKDPQRKKRWTSSHNLAKPFQQKNDFKYTRRKIERLATSPDAGKEFFEKQYKNHEIVSIAWEYFEQTGWHCYLKMWRKEKPRKRVKKKE